MKLNHHIILSILISLFSLAYTQAKAGDFPLSEEYIKPPFIKEDKVQRVGGYDDIYLKPNDKILFWDKPTQANKYDSDLVVHRVFMLADVSFDETKEKTNIVLKNYGKFKIECKDDKLSQLHSGWGSLVIAKNQNMGGELLDNFNRIINGSLSRSAKRNLIKYHLFNPSPTSRVKTDQIIGDISICTAVATRNFGALGQSKGETFVQIADVSKIIGHKATAIEITQHDKIPNSGANIRNFFNLGSLGRAPEASEYNEYYVDARLYNGIKEAISTQGNRPQIADSPADWIEFSNEFNFEKILQNLQ